MNEQDRERLSNLVLLYLQHRKRKDFIEILKLIDQALTSFLSSQWKSLDKPDCEAVKDDISLRLQSGVLITVKNPARFWDYVHRLAHSMAKKRWEAKQRVRGVEKILKKNSEGELSPSKQDFRDRILFVLARMKAEEPLNYSVLWRKYFEGKNYKTIGTELNISEQTSRNRAGVGRKSFIINFFRAAKTGGFLSTAEMCNIWDRMKKEDPINYPVFRAFCEGKSNKVISKTLKMSAEAVRQHVLAGWKWFEKNLFSAKNRCDS